MDYIEKVIRMINQGKPILTLLWRGPLSYRNQSIDLQSKSMDWFLYDNGLRHERVNRLWNKIIYSNKWKKNRMYCISFYRKTFFFG